MKNKILFFRNLVVRILRPDLIFAVAVSLMIASELFAIGVLSYLGTYSRLLADDYCESAALQSGSILSVVFDRFLMGGSNRYSNLLFVGLAELMGMNNIRILPLLMLFLWAVASIWVVHEIRKLAGVVWHVSMDILLGLSVVFFSSWQAPNLYQTFFWRSGMATHFAPLVFISLLLGFIFFRINSAVKLSSWVLLFIFLVSFVIGGFSEPPATFMVVLLLLFILFALKWADRMRRQVALNLLVYSLAGVLLALIIMLFSPTMDTLGHPSIIGAVTATARTFGYTIDFIEDTVRTKPLPTLLSFVSTLVLFFNYHIKSNFQPFTSRRKQQVLTAMAVVPLIQYLLIAASFAPSAYGEGYPADRAQFLGRLVMTLSLLIEGALLGMLFSDWFRRFSNSRFRMMAGSLVFFILALYPLRAGLIMLAMVPEYNEWTSTWDLRSMEIASDIDRGDQELVVRWLPTREGIKEIDARPGHWVNKCVADYYGVISVRSVPMSNE